ncbi:dual specificity protein phosphatase 23-like isoform X1 [Onthophagus taurus]|uniref:dual specificity protein phosphatase 23-like isoform X1 n=1 Tax=Onthophagus taurus TaxID=166361 RepID=UPI0039BEAF4D
MSENGNENINEEVDSYPPWNFSWVVDNKLAAMAWPQNKENLRYIYEEGVRHLVTLSPEKLPPIEQFPQLEWTSIPIEEFGAPTIKDILKFIDVCQKCQQKNQAVGIHCRMGRGRTGVMAACYLVRFLDLAPERAITEIRLKRPGSVEVIEQERAVIKYFDCLRGTLTSEIQGIKDKTLKHNLYSHKK